MKHARAIAIAATIFMVTGSWARQACEPGAPAQLAPAVNPVTLTEPGEVQWFTIPVPGGHMYDISFAIPRGFGTIRTSAFGNDCTRPLSAGSTCAGFSTALTVPESDNLLRIRVETHPGLIEPFTATFVVTDRGPTTDDLPGSPAWARTLTPDGVWVSGLLDHPCDSDFYRIATVPGDVYRVERRGLRAPWGESNFRTDYDGTSVWLFRADTNSVVFSVGGGSDSTPGPYQVRALAVTHPLSADQPGSCTEAEPAAIGQPVLGEAGPGDEDWFAFPVAAGHRYRTTLLSTLWSGPRLYWNVCDTLVCSTWLAGGRQEFTTDRAGTVLAAVNGPFAGTAKPFELRLDDLGPAPPEEANQLADARPIADGELVHGVLESDTDTDAFRFAVDPGWLYALDIHGDLWAALIDPARSYTADDLGGTRTQGPDGVWHSSVRLLMPQGGSTSRWLVLSNSFWPAPAPYSINVRRVAFVDDADLSDNPSEPTPITGSNPSIDFHLTDSRDQDWAVFRGPPRRKYQVNAVAATLIGGAVELGFGTNDAGVELAPGSLTTLETDEGGSLVLGGVPWSSTPTTLTATVTDIGPATDTVPAIATGEFPIRPNRDTIRGVIDSGNDHDAYLLRGQPGHAYRIVLLASPGVGRLGTYVRPAASFEIVRAFAQVEPPQGAAETWFASARFTLPSDGRPYALDVNAEGGSMIGTPFQVRIESVCRADWNDDGHVGVGDLLDYLTDFLGTPVNAEFDRVGGVTNDDLWAFLAAYFAGCEQP